jgi:hypothetical protein
MQSIPSNQPAPTGATEMPSGVDNSPGGADQVDPGWVKEAITRLLGGGSDRTRNSEAAPSQPKSELKMSKTMSSDPQRGSGDAAATQTEGSAELTETEDSGLPPEPEIEPEPAFVPNDKMEILSTFAKHMDKVPNGLRWEDLEELANDESLPQDLRDAYAALRDDPELYRKLDSADKAGGLSGSKIDGNDGNAGHSDLRKAFNDPEFVQYSRDKSAAYAENYIPSDAEEGDTTPRPMTESDAARELYLYADSLPDNVDKEELQRIVDGQVNGKCPAQLQAAAQYMLDHPESFEKLASDGSCSRGELEDNAAPLINLREDESSALDTLKNNKDYFFRDGTMTRDTLADLAADESVPDDVRDAAATLLESDVVFGMLDNGNKGHVPKDAWIKKNGNQTHDGAISNDDVNALIDKKLSETNRTPPPSALAGCGRSRCWLLATLAWPASWPQRCHPVVRVRSGCLGRLRSARWRCRTGFYCAARAATSTSAPSASEAPPRHRVPAPHAAAPRRCSACGRSGRMGWARDLLCRPISRPTIGAAPEASSYRAQAANSGTCVRTGMRQSMPSSSIDNCAGVNATLPDVACGQTKRPRSRRFARSISPWPSNHSTLRMSPRRPRNTKTWPQKGFAAMAVCATAARPSKPFLMSV